MVNYKCFSLVDLIQRLHCMIYIDLISAKKHKRG